MKMHVSSESRVLGMVCGVVMLLASPGCVAAEPAAVDVAAFHEYVSGVEARLALQHRSRNFFLAGMTEQSEARLRGVAVMVEEITPAGGKELQGALLHHWRGTAFVAGATGANFERMMRDFAGYPKYFAPEVLEARVSAVEGDRMQASMRVRQKHVLTVVMDTAYDVSFGRLDAAHGYSVSRSTRVEEIDAAGTSHERVLSATEAHGFLWRMNTYWSYEERDGGLYVQLESVTLTRGIPKGLWWVVGPFVESIPRESVEFTLRAVCSAMKK